MLTTLPSFLCSHFLKYIYIKLPSREDYKSISFFFVFVVWPALPSIEFNVDLQAQSHCKISPCLLSSCTILIIRCLLRVWSRVISLTWWLLRVSSLSLSLLFIFRLKFRIFLNPYLLSFDKNLSFLGLIWSPEVENVRAIFINFSLVHSDEWYCS